MPDIAMCRSKVCRLSETCHRHADSGTIPDGKWQTYIVPDPDEDTRNGCCMYWHVDQHTLFEDGDDDPTLQPHESGDGRIVRKDIDDY